MSIKMEEGDGCYTTFCSLGAITWLSERIENAFFLVIGTETCNHFLTITLHPYRFPHAEFATIIIEEKDIATGEYTGKIVEIVESMKEQLKGKKVFLMNTCSTKILQLNMDSVAQELNKECEGKFFNVETDGLTSAYTQGEDLLIYSYLKTLTIKENGKQRAVFLGLIEKEAREEINSVMSELGIECIFLPWFDTYPEISKNDKIISIPPYLHTSIMHLKRKGLEFVETVTPLGTSLSNEFFEKIASVFGKDFKKRQNDEKVEGDFYIMANNLMEPALALYIISNGGNVSYMGVPQKTLSNEMNLWKIWQRVVDFKLAPDYTEELRGIFSKDFDVAITPNEYAALLNKRGIKTIWSLKFLSGNIYGFSAAKRMEKMFNHPEERYKSLERSFGGLVK